MTDKRVAVYVPFRTFLAAIEALEDGLPRTLDTSVFPSFSSGVRSQLLSALRFLGLIDDRGVVTEALTDLVENKNDRGRILRDAIERAYPTIAELAGSNASQMQLEDAMREYGVGGETLEKAIRFYLQAAEYTGLLVSPLWRKANPGVKFRERSKRQSVNKRRNGASPRSDGIAEKEHYAPNANASDLVTVQIESSGTIRLGIARQVAETSAAGRDFILSLVEKLIDKAKNPAP
jgi:hypothetical protein